jgi:enamine deaminase RidA (YjgF/YER057c/UK114 family)
LSVEVLFRLQEAGFEMPQPTIPAANYVPVTRLGAFLFVSGQTPTLDGKPLYCGIVGKDVSVAQAQKAAQVCALNILSHANRACDGDLSRILQCLSLRGSVRAEPQFTDHSIVMDGAPDLFVLALGDRGRHARVAVGAHSLPRGVPVEIEAVFAVA